MFAAVTCRPDIMFSTIYLSQFSDHPAEIHYHAVKRVFRYLRSTISYGIHYWRTKPSSELPDIKDPSILPDSHQVKLPSFTSSNPCGFSDAD